MKIPEVLTIDELAQAVVAHYGLEPHEEGYAYRSVANLAASKWDQQHRRFAAAKAAMQGLLAYPGSLGPVLEGETVYQAVARVSVGYADAIIAKLEKEVES